MARINFKALEYFDRRAKRDLAAVGPIKEYIKHDQSFTLGGFAVYRRGERIGSMALRSETRPDGLKVLVIVAASVHDKRSILVNGIDEVKGMARKNGFHFVRAHTDRPRVVKAFLKCGGAAIIGFKTVQEYRSKDLEFITDYIAEAGEAVMWLEVLNDG